MSVNKQMRILLVDDFKSMVMLTGGMLRQMGFSNIDEAANGRFAIEKMNDNKYDLILSDWNMDEMNGLDLLRAVRANPATQSTPFVMITAEGKVDNIVEAKKAGANNYIIKPFSAVTLKEKLSAVLGAF